MVRCRSQHRRDTVRDISGASRIRKGTALDIRRTYYRLLSALSGWLHRRQKAHERHGDRDSQLREQGSLSLCGSERAAACGVDRDHDIRRSTCGKRSSFVRAMDMGPGHRRAHYTLDIHRDTEPRKGQRHSHERSVHTDRHTVSRNIQKRGPFGSGSGRDVLRSCDGAQRGHASFMASAHKRLHKRS